MAPRSSASLLRLPEQAALNSQPPRRGLPPGTLGRRWPDRGFWLVVLLFVWLFSDVLFANRQLMFRDAGHYYHPLLQYVRQSWYSGEIPLWNPYENLGEPLAASPTSLVFYPGALLLLIPVSFDWAYKLFLLAHLLLAAWGAAWLARQYRRTPAAATLAALAYAGGGHVLFQYCNVVYLIGAAWLPFAWLALDHTLGGRSLRAAIALAAAWAMMLLGGDPQLAYHLGLAALLLVWLRRRDPWPKDFSWRQRLTRSRWALLAFAGVLACSLAAVQAFPAWQLARRTDRSQSDIPRNVYDWAAAALSFRDNAAPPAALAEGAVGAPLGDAATPWHATLLGKSAPPPAHSGVIYNFSLGPWELAELLWPNVGGSPFPQNSRWFDSLSFDGRSWTYSLYMGIVPVVLAIRRWRWRRGSIRIRWLSLTLLLAVLASLGEYGLGWLIREALQFISPQPWNADEQSFPLGNAFGGLYWLAVMLCPGYGSFRYPAKCFTVAALAIAILAAYGWDDLRRLAPRRRVQCCLGLFAAGSGLLALSALVTRPLATAAFAAVQHPNVPFGLLNPQAAWLAIVVALAHAAVVAGLAWLCLKCWPSTSAHGGLSFHKKVPLAGQCLLLLVTIDLAVAHRHLLPTVPSQVVTAEPKFAELVKTDAAMQNWHAFRTYRAALPSPSTWRQSASLHRLREVVQFDRDTLYPRYPLPLELGVLPAAPSYLMLDVQTFLQQLPPTESGAQPFAPHCRQLLDHCGVSYLLLPQGERPVDSSAWRQVRNDNTVPGVRLWARTAPPIRAWLVDRAVVIPPAGDRPAEITKTTTDVLSRLFQSGGPRNLAVIEDEAMNEGNNVHETRSAALAAVVGKSENRLDHATASRVQIVSISPHRLEIVAQTSQPALLVLNDLYDPDWNAELISPSGKHVPLPVFRTNRIMRGVPLPAGEHRVVYYYAPTLFYLGAAVSLISLLGLATTAGVALWSARKRAAIPSANG